MNDYITNYFKDISDILFTKVLVNDRYNTKLNEKTGKWENIGSGWKEYGKMYGKNQQEKKITVEQLDWFVQGRPSDILNMKVNSLDGYNHSLATTGTAFKYLKMDKNVVNYIHKYYTLNDISSINISGNNNNYNPSQN